MSALTVATDGSRIGPPTGGPIGWAYIAEDGRYRQGGRALGSNQYAELAAVLFALSDFHDVDLIIQSDSQYAINCATTWKASWQRNKYKTKKKEPVVNRDVIEAIHVLLDARSEPVKFVWVRGHSGHALNELADKLATGASAHARKVAGSFDKRGRYPTA